MAHQTIDNQTLTEILFDVFRTHGYEGASIAQLSDATGLKKSSLYHRFPAGKEDMALAVVNHVNQQLQDFIIEPLLDRTTPVEKRFDNMMDVLIDFYADGKKNCLLNVLNLGVPNKKVRERLRKGYEACRDALSELGKEIGFSDKKSRAQAGYFFMLMEGALVIQRLNNDPKTFQESLNHAKILFFSELA